MVSGIDLLKSKTETSSAAAAERRYSFTPSGRAMPYLEAVGMAETSHKLPPNLLHNLLQAESAFDPKAVSSAGAIGIAQIMPGFHPTVDPTDPLASIDYAGKHLRGLYEELGDWDKAIAAYNTGAGNVEKLGMKKLPKETREYLKRINEALISGGKEGKATSGLELLKQMKVEPMVPMKVPKVKPKEPERRLTNVERFYTESGSLIWNPSTSAMMARRGFGPKPEGGWDEFGRPLDAKGEPYQAQKINETALGNAITDTFKGLSTLVTNPYETARGIIQFGMALPGFIIGIIGGVGKAGETLVNQVAFGKLPNFEEAHRAASEGLQESFEFFQPWIESLTGKPTKESQLVGEVAMAPLSTIVAASREVSLANFFADEPGDWEVTRWGKANARGLINFGGDILGLLTMGVLLHGKGRKAEFAKEVEEVTMEALDIKRAEDVLRNAPQDIVANIEAKKLAVKKQRLATKANKYAKKFGDDMLVAEEIARQTEEVAKAQIRPVVTEKGPAAQIPEDAVPTSEVLSKDGSYFVKHEGTWYSDTGREVTNPHKKGVLTRSEKPFQGERIDPNERPDVELETKIREKVEEKAVEIEEPIDLDEARRAKIEDTLSKKIKGKGMPPHLVRLQSFIKETEKFLHEERSSKSPNLDKIKTTIKNLNDAKAELAAEIEEATPKGKDPRAAEIAELNIALGKAKEKGASKGDIAAIEERLERLTEEKYGEEKIDWFGEDKQVTDVDRQTGDKSSPLDSPENKSFNQSKSKTDELSNALSEKKAEGNLEVSVQKLINDVNRWRHGEKIDIAETRSRLSAMAARADDFRSDFITGVDHLIFTENVTEAANWAKKTVRVDDIGTKLDMMIPFDEVPKLVIQGINKVFGKRVIKLKEVYRNKKLWKDTGLWIGRDKKWRMEVGDPDIPVVKPSKPSPGVTRTRTTLGNVYKNESLFRIFPDTQEIKVVFDDKYLGFAKHDPGMNRTLADHTITINPTGIYKVSKSAYRGLLHHEVQHAINTFIGAFAGTTTRFEDAKIVADKLSLLATRPKMNPLVRDRLLWIAEELIKTANVRHFKGVLLPLLESSKELLGLSKSDIAELRRPTGVGAVRRYRESPGEMESRLSEIRSEMSEADRSREAPWKTLNRMLKAEGLPKEAGFELYSLGGAVGEGAKKIVEGAKKYSKYVDDARGYKKLDIKKGLSEAKRASVRSFIDKSGNIRKDFLNKLDDVGYRIIQAMYLTKGASSLSARMLKQMQKEVYSGLSKAEKAILDKVILADRMIDIGKYKSKKEFTHPAGLKVDDFIAYRELFPQLEKLDPSVSADIGRRAGAYFDWMKKPLNDMLDSGLISDTEYADLSSHNYRRIESVEKIFDKSYRAKVGGKKRTIYDSGVEALQRGRETDIYEPSSEIMALEVFNRSYGRIFNNEANRTLLGLAKDSPDNPFVRVKSKETKIPSGWTRVFLYEGGKRKSVYLHPEVANEWILSNPELSYKMSQVLRLASGSPVLRTFATGINWGFAVANIPRDVMHTWFAARVFEKGEWKPVYSSTLPIFGLQIGRDLTTIFTDAALRRGRYDEYIKEGGGMEFLVHQGRLLQRGRHLEGPIDKFYNFMGYFGETSEIMTRLAIRERVIRRRAAERGISTKQARNVKEIVQEATFAARDYMDFSQGGTITKGLDNALPYLNASVQGTRGLFRAFKDNPAASTYKLMQFASVVTGLYIAMGKMHPESSKNLKGNIDMQNNLCIPLGDDFGFMDEQGDMRYPYIKIPLDPGQKFFKTFFEASADKWLGNDVDINRVVDSLKEQSPVGVTELPPSLSGALGYMTNKDFWLNEDIWTKTQEPFGYPKSKEEFIPGRTPQAYIDIGKATGLSPERTRYAVEELTTSGTVWSYLLGRGYKELFSDLPDSNKEEHLAMVLSRTPVVKRFFSVTHPYSKHAGSIDKAEEASVIKRFVENRGVDTLIRGYLYEDNVGIKEIQQYARSFKDRDTYHRLMDRFKWEQAIKSLPEKSFWRRIKGLHIKAKAQAFVERLNEADEEGRRKLWREYAIVGRAGDVISKEFRREIRREIIEVREEYPEPPSYIR